MNQKNKKDKFGGGVLEYSLMVGGILVVLLTVFYPYVDGLSKNIKEDVSTWYETEQKDIFK
jgi:uncharacterized protein (UPF0333 family)